MLNEINSDNPVEEVEASDIKEDNTSVENSSPSEEIIKTKDYLSTSLFEDKSSGRINPICFIFVFQL